MSTSPSTGRQPSPRRSASGPRRSSTRSCLHIQPAKIEKHALRFTYTFGLGLLSLYLFLLLTVSGLLLMFVYVPSTEQAYLRMQDLHSSVSFGYILRGMHFWSANAMIAVVFFHMCRVFYTGAV